MLKTSAIFHKPEVLVLGATRNRKTKTDYRHDDRAVTNICLTTIVSAKVSSKAHSLIFVQ